MSNADNARPDSDPGRSPNRIGLALNRLLYRFAKHWHRIFIGLLSLLVAGVFIAPMLMAVGLPDAARAVYTLYFPMCHQFGFRSLYLFGDQPVYPREVAGTDWVPFEEAVANDPSYARAYADTFEALYGRPLDREVTAADIADFTLVMQLASKAHTGNPQMGYKTAVCQRDVSIYAGMLIFLVIYTRPPIYRRLRPLPFFWFVLMGAGPIALDGLSQLMSYPPFEWWPARETLPGFRIATGFLFGFMGGWLAFPLFALNMQDIQAQVAHKFRQRGLSL